MATLATELFVQCVYSADLSYEDLMQTEGDLKLGAQQLLDANKAEYIHFEEMGDTMRIQCMFAEYEENLFHTLCDGFAPYMNGHVEATLLFVDKGLNFLHTYAISNGQWQEGVVHLPPAGPITKELRRIDPPNTIRP